MKISVVEESGYNMTNEQNEGNIIITEDKWISI